MHALNWVACCEFIEMVENLKTKNTQFFELVYLILCSADLF